MDFLYTFFERQLELRQDEGGNVVIGDTVFSPVAILRADQTAYEDEFSKWLSERWLPEQEEVLKDILGVHANQKRFTDLCATLKNGQLIPLVGSGMSIPSGLTAWSEFLRALRCHSSMAEKDLEDLLSRWAYEDAAEQLAAAMPERLFDERIEHDLRIDNPDGICGAVVFLPEIFDRLIRTLPINITDSWDKLEQSELL